MIRDGKLVALAISTNQRSAVLPELPTIAEAGVPDAQFDFWIGLLAPAKMSREIVAKLNSELERVLEQAEVRQRLAALGAEPMPMSPTQFDAYMREQFTSLGRLMKAAGVTAK
jgi:tripartite-type tricarboxylate transporter receptor subunit TctC